tara:strand:- start:146 stop:871 length:726 start_codon:yes stop_codon:yes gene_type:complete
LNQCPKPNRAKDTKTISKGHTMNIKAATILAALATASVANAEIIIDDWSTSQGPYNPSNGWNQTQAGNMLGDLRRTFIQNAGSQDGEVSGEISDNRLRFSATNGANNFFTTYWDGPDRQGTVPYDFSEGGENDRFRLDSYNTTNYTSALVVVKFSDGTFANAHFDFDARVGPHSGPTEIMFSSFAGATDWSNVEWVALDLGISADVGAEASVTVGTFSVVPAPASAMLLGLAGLATAKRRR